MHTVAEFVEAAQGIVNQDPTVSRNIFFSTDNQTVLDEIERGALDRYNFTFYYTRCVHGLLKKRETSRLVIWSATDRMQPLSMRALTIDPSLRNHLGTNGGTTT